MIMYSRGICDMSKRKEADRCFSAGCLTREVHRTKIKNSHGTKKIQKGNDFFKKISKNTSTFRIFLLKSQSFSYIIYSK